MTISHWNIEPYATNADSEASGWRIVAADAQRRVEAVDWLVAQGPVPDRSHTQRFLDYARANAVPLDRMWSLVDGGGSIQATALGVPSPGRTAMLFATHPRSPALAIAIGRLMRHAGDELAKAGVHLAQALYDPGELLAREAAAAGGMIELAHLSYLERPVPRKGTTPGPSWPEGATVHPYDDESIRPDLLDALQQSYQGTLDCPGLLGLRRTEDILAGHQASGRFEPGLWTLLRVRGQASGVLLLNPSPAHQTVELVYLGLSPRARGGGLGRALLLHGLRLLEDRPERTINLAVDEANAPALRLYRGQGFRTALRRVAMIRPLPHRTEPA